MMQLLHAPAGGVRLHGQHFGGGEFLPFYVPRERMPQVDAADLPALFAFVERRGVAVSRCTASPRLFHARQRIDMERVVDMDDALLAKPVLTSRDYYILDGNHRWMAHVLSRTKMSVMKIDLAFDDALDLLFAFPKTYSYGDGDYHPVTN